MMRPRLQVREASRPANPIRQLLALINPWAIARGFAVLSVRGRGITAEMVWVRGHCSFHGQGWEDPAPIRATHGP